MAKRPKSTSDKKEEDRTPTSLDLYEQSLRGTLDRVMMGEPNK